MKHRRSLTWIYTLFGAWAAAALAAAASGLFGTDRGEPRRALALQLVAVVASSAGPD